MEFRPIVGWPKRACIEDSGVEMTILRPAYYGDSERNFRVFEATLLWGNTEDRTAGKQRERDRVRESYRSRKTLRVFQIGELYLRCGVGAGGAAILGRFSSSFERYYRLYLRI